MKSLIYMALALITATSWSQPGGDNHHNRHQMKEKMAELTPEQLADLKTKEMTLQLDLNQLQQEEVYTINLTQIQARQQQKENGKKPEEMTSDELYQFRASQLDQRIATKEKLQSVLNPEQLAKLEQMDRRKRGKRHERGRTGEHKRNRQ